MMKHGFFRNLAFAAALMFVGLFASSASAWDDIGHSVVAYIAWQQMTPQTRDAVIKILRDAPEDSDLSALFLSYSVEPDAIRRRQFFEFAATWSDIVRNRDFETRSKKYHKGNWHYADTFWTQKDGRVEIQNVPGESGEAILRLKEFDKTISDSTVANADKAVAVAWIMHITGDIHQPLHTSARVTDTEPKGDQGGNLFLLSPKGAPRGEQLNLHTVWDAAVKRYVPLKGDECGREYVESVASKILKKYPFQRMQADLKLERYDDWQSESFALNASEVFTPDLKRFEPPSPRYSKNAFRVAQRQLALAGYRLGETLNSAFGSMPKPSEETKND